MLNSYNIEDFTEQHYEDILKSIKREGYIPIFYNEKYMSKSVLLRHDIDFSPHRALALSKIEKKQGIKATYFLLLSSEFYNIFERKIKNIIASILNNGHEIGLHFDPSVHEIKEEDDLVRFLSYEKQIIEELFKIKINAFSFHNPTPENLGNGNLKYADMINTYSDVLKNDFYYCSDSNGYWRYERMYNVIKNSHDKLHLLTHPEWWQNETSLPRERVKRAVYGRANNLIKGYDSFLKNQGRINIGK